MLKIIIIYITISALTIQILIPILPYLEYWINKDYISEVLCVNKDNPETKCNGMCHLKKQISRVLETNKNEENKTKSPSIKNPILFSDIIFENISKTKLFIPFATKIKWGILFWYSYLFQSENFHPPQLEIINTN